MKKQRVIHATSYSNPDGIIHWLEGLIGKPASPENENEIVEEIIAFQIVGQGDRAYGVAVVNTGFRASVLRGADLSRVSVQKSVHSSGQKTT